MAEHGEGHHGHESSEKHAKHHSWLEKVDGKTMTGAAGMATLGANYGLSLLAGVAFPPIILAGATVAAYAALTGKKHGKKEHGHRTHH